MRVVLDLNLFVSALIGRPATAVLLEQWREQSFVMVLSEPLLAELAAVLARPKFKNYFSDEDVRLLLELIRERAILVEPMVKLALCRDPKDDILLEVAASAHAHYLVTGDKDLFEDSNLVATMFQDYHVQIITASALLTLLSEQKR